MKKFLVLSVISALLLVGCGSSKKEYNVNTYGQDKDYNVVETQTYNPESQWFTFRYNTNTWGLEEWNEEDAPNVLALVHTGYEDGSCYILPGTIGEGNSEGYLIMEGVFLTNNYSGRSLEIKTPGGIPVQWVVGYEVGEWPYIFEVNLPEHDADLCRQDANEVVMSFYTQPLEEEATEETTEEEVTEEDDEVTVELPENSGMIVVEEAPTEE